MPLEGVSPFSPSKGSDSLAGRVREACYLWTSGTAATAPDCKSGISHGGSSPPSSTFPIPLTGFLLFTVKGANLAGRPSAGSLPLHNASMVELADTQDLGSCDRKVIRVQVPLLVLFGPLAQVVSASGSYPVGSRFKPEGVHDYHRGLTDKARAF